MRRLILALGVFFVTATASHAATITTFAGSSGVITDGANNPAISNSQTIIFPNLTISGIGNPFVPTFFTNGNLTVNTTGQLAGFAIASPISIAFNVPAGAYGAFGATAAGVVTFNVINPLEVSNQGPTSVNFGSLTDGTPELQLASNTTSLDFGPIGQLFHLQFSAQGLTYSNTPSGTFSNSPQGALASGSFTAIAVQPVPEPSTFAMAGVMLGAVSIGFILRRRRDKLAQAIAA
jgi:hypothetical protein